MSGWRWHDLRRSARTGMTRLGVSRDHAEAALNHVSGRTALERTYDRHDFAPEVIASLSRWQAHVASLVTGQPSADVVPIRKPRLPWLRLAGWAMHNLPYHRRHRSRRGREVRLTVGTYRVPDVVARRRTSSESGHSRPARRRNIATGPHRSRQVKGLLMTVFRFCSS